MNYHKPTEPQRSYHNYIHNYQYQCQTAASIRNFLTTLNNYGYNACCGQFGNLPLIAENVYFQNVHCSKCIAVASPISSYLQNSVRNLFLSSYSCFKNYFSHDARSASIQSKKAVILLDSEFHFQYLVFNASFVIAVLKPYCNKLVKR